MDRKLQAHFLNLFSFALADANVDVKETEKLYEIAIDRGIERNELDYIIDNPHKVKFNIPSTEYDIAIQILDIAKIIIADGIIDIREIIALRDFLKRTIENSKNVEEITELVIDSVKNQVKDEIIVNKLINLIK